MQGRNDIIAIVNLSRRLSPSEVLTMVDAVSRQQAEDVCPLWSAPHRPLNVYSDVAQLPPGTTDIVPITDEPGDPGVLGWHSMGLAPIGRVFVSPVLDNGGCVLADPNDPSRTSIAGVLSHEAGIELPVDPTCDQYAIDADGNEWDLECADAVQRNQYLKIARMPWGDIPVAVSDFVLPAYFDPTTKPGTPCNFMHATMPLPGPFTIAPGGYSMRNGSAIFARRADGSTILPDAWWLAMRPPGTHRHNRTGARKLYTPGVNA
jgi:hypothetical protein